MTECPIGWGFIIHQVHISDINPSNTFKFSKEKYPLFLTPQTIVFPFLADVPGTPLCQRHASVYKQALFPIPSLPHTYTKIKTELEKWESQRETLAKCLVLR